MHTLLKTFVCLLISFFVASGQASAQDGPASAIEESSLGSTNNVHKAGDLFFSGQFGKDDIKIISASKITRVVSLRLADEIDWNEPIYLELVSSAKKRARLIRRSVYAKNHSVSADWARSAGVS